MWRNDGSALRVRARRASRRARAFQSEWIAQVLETRLLPASLTLTPATLPDDTLDRAYDETVTASGGTGPYTYSVSTGALPTGLSLNTSTGAITGTPSATGTSNFTIGASDTGGDTGSQAYSITINPAISFTTTSLPGATVNTTYSQQITATGGTGALTYAVTSGTLRSGLTLSSAGLLAGTPSTPGTSTFTVTATDTAGATAGQVLSLTINATNVLTVTKLQRFGFHAQPTIFVLTFSAPLASGPAQNINNYNLFPLINGQLGRPIALKSAVYDATNDTVTLTPAHNVYLYAQYELTVNGTSPNGLTDTSGNFLSGTSGTPGTNYVKTFGKEILAGPNIPSGTPSGLTSFINNEWTNELASRFAALAAAAGDTPAATPASAASHNISPASRARAAVAAPVAVTPVSLATSNALTGVHPAAVDHVLAAIVLPDATGKKKS